MKSRLGKSLRLYRSRSGWLLGVCQGLAERFDFSANGVRLLFVILQLTVAPFMFIVYIALAILLKPEPLLDRWSRFERDYFQDDRT